ncbi:hypothetical protein [Streptococcus ferus]|uniref:hypothetical protein n=1 Tax=Streptococcus ferus TaxID=1345 RepID=UPI002354376F|nr:hypothetical protein [Streptococcus ferus]
MYAIFKGKKFDATHEVDHIYTLISKVRYDGFEQYINILGQVAENTFVKEVNENDLDYLYELSYELKYKGRWFHLFTALNPRAISEDYFEIILSFLDLEEKELAEKLDFERTDKFYYTKRIYRKDIEELKVIELPQGIFSSQGKKETILEGQEIDDYFASITD